MSKLIRYLLFAALGAVGGWMYYTNVGCTTGTCVITSSVYSTMTYTGLLGILVAYIIGQFKLGEKVTEET